MLFQRCARLGVFLVMLPGYVLSQESKPKFQIVAEVSDASGAVLVGATVQVQGISAPTKFSGTTNEMGKFRIQLEAEKYTVSIMEWGFKTLVQQLEVTSAEDQRFSFVLEPASAAMPGPCCSVPDPGLETEMSKLPDQLVLPPTPVLPPIKLHAPRRSPIVRFFSGIRQQLGF
jgi:hypothetical protein